jgi:integrase
MPRPSKGARLYVKRLKGRTPVYVIRDGAKEVSTGYALGDVERAQAALRDYLAAIYRPDTGEKQLSNIGVSDVLMLYFKDLPADSPSRETIRYNIKALNAYWGDKSLADVKGSTCRHYITQRTKQTTFANASEKPPQSFFASPETLKKRQSLTQRGVKLATARHELKILQAAINHWHRESPLEAVPKVSLPKVQSRRERWLARDEVAALLKACRRLSREGRKAAKGAIQFTDYSHVQRFILIGIYTGTRHDALLNLRWSGSRFGGHIDLERGIVFRRGSAERETTKRRPPVLVSRRLQAFMARWKRMDGETIQNVIHHNGHPIAKMRRAWNTVRTAAGLGPDVTPHTLRHSAASWLLWGREAKGARPATKPLTIWETAEVLGADASTVERVYGHHRRVE